MSETHVLIGKAYAGFNARDVDGVFALMSEDVRWPRASEGGEVVGKEEIRAYWVRQWSEFDPYVTPLEFVEAGGGKTDVRVRQVVKSVAGKVLWEGEVGHRFTVSDGVITRMELLDSAPGAAFGR